jgi:hypothetical protein
MIDLLRKLARLGRAVARRVAMALHRRSGSAEPPPPQPRRIGLAQVASADGEFVVFFSPEAGVVPHYVTHCVVAKTLQERGHRVLLVRCLDVFPRCVVMDSIAAPQDMDAAQRQAICATCIGHANDMAGRYGLDVLDLAELVTNEIRAKVAALTADLPRDVRRFEHDGIRFGQICAAEAAVIFKSADLTGGDPAVRRLMVLYLKGALLSYLAMQRLVATGKVKRVVYFNEYATLLGAALAARQRGVPTSLMTLASLRGVDRRRPVFMDDSIAIASYRRRLAQWADWRELPLPASTVAALADDSLYRISGNSIMIYSPARTGAINNLFARLRLASERRLLVAFTSSLDELAANSEFLDAMGLSPFSEVQPFNDQIDWLEALIAHVEASGSLQLVVRVHPREGANRREATSSSHLLRLRERFDRPFDHVRFVWPGDDVSSYDLMELADVGLSAWSSTALEMARFGTPAVIAFDRHTPLPVGDVVSWSPTRQSYFRCIEEALHRPPSLDLVRFAYRWTHLHILGCAGDIGDIVPDSTYPGLPPFVMPKQAGFIEEVLVAGRPALNVNRDRLLVAPADDASATEEAALRRQLRRLVWFFCTGEDRADDYRLVFSTSPDEPLAKQDGAMLVQDAAGLEFRTAELTVRTRSRIVARLGALAAQETRERIAA